MLRRETGQSKEWARVACQDQRCVFEGGELVDEAEYGVRRGRKKARSCGSLNDDGYMRVRCSKLGGHPERSVDCHKSWNNRVVCCALAKCKCISERRQP